MSVRCTHIPTHLCLVCHVRVCIACVGLCLQGIHVCMCACAQAYRAMCACVARVYCGLTQVSVAYLRQDLGVILGLAGQW